MMNINCFMKNNKIAGYSSFLSLLLLIFLFSINHKIHVCELFCYISAILLTSIKYKFS